MRSVNLANVRWWEKYGTSEINGLFSRKLHKLCIRRSNFRLFSPGLSGCNHGLSPVHAGYMVHNRSHSYLVDLTHSRHNRYLAHVYRRIDRFFRLSGFLTCSKYMTQLKRVAIIGAGPCGLAAAKALKMEPVGVEVDVYDRKRSIGGAWFYDGERKSLAMPPVPSLDPNGSDLSKKTGKPFRSYVSPLYKHMETNLIDTLMEYKDVPFAPRTHQFRSRDEILQYLKEYVSTIPGPVNFLLNTSVDKLFKKDSQWIVAATDVETLESREELYDAVVVANGHNEHPYVPDVPGLREWSEVDRDSITHAKFYVDAEPYKHKNVLVVGNYASGGDLSTQIGVVANQVYVSTTAETLTESEFEQILFHPVVERYDVATRSATLKGGRVLKDLDAIVFCTGYLYTLPFLNEYLPGLTNGQYIKDLYRQMFYIHDTTLSFIGVNKLASPFPLSESQAAIIARVITNRIELPEKDFLQKSYLAEFATKSPSRFFHNLPNCDYTYCNDLYEWILYTKTANEGLVPIYWDAEKVKDRVYAPELKIKRFDFVKENAQDLRKQGKPFDFPATWL